jgi:hypothetical protein
MVEPPLILLFWLPLFATAMPTRCGGGDEPAEEAANPILENRLEGEPRLPPGPACARSPWSAACPSGARVPFFPESGQPAAGGGGVCWARYKGSGCSDKAPGREWAGVHRPGRSGRGPLGMGWFRGTPSEGGWESEDETKVSLQAGYVSAGGTSPCAGSDIPRDFASSVPTPGSRAPSRSASRQDLEPARRDPCVFSDFALHQRVDRRFRAGRLHPLLSPLCKSLPTPREISSPLHALSTARRCRFYHGVLSSLQRAVGSPLHPSRRRSPGRSSPADPDPRPRPRAAP